MPTTIHYLIVIALFVLLLVVGQKAKLPHELPKNVQEAETLNTTKRDDDRTALKWDFAFIPIYVSFTGLLCFIAGSYADRLSLIPFRFTWVVISLLFVGALVDICENLAQLQILNAHFEPPWPQIARWFGLLKWVFPGLGTLYALVAFIVSVHSAFRPKV